MTLSIGVVLLFLLAAGAVFTGEVAAAKPKNVDLIISDISWFPSQPVSTGTTNIYVTVKNIGTSGVKTTLYFGNTLWIDELVNPVTLQTYTELAAGATETFQYTTSLAGGIHKLKGVADCWDQVTESNEDNNERVEYVTVLLPDVAAVDIYTSPSSPIDGQLATIYFKISTTSVPFSTTVSTTLRIDGYVKADENLYGSTTSQTITYSLEITLAAGSHLVVMMTDADSVLTESSETNNQRVETIIWVEIDSDGDGLSDSYERSIGTNPYDATTDSDAWNDGDEVLKYYTNPLLADTDGDTIQDNLDYDPLNNIQVTVKISEVFARDVVDTDGADFFWFVIIGGVMKYPQIPWSYNQNHIYPGWTATWDVPDGTRYVVVEINLYDKEGDGINERCDIDDVGLNNDFLELTYDVATGSWSGGDYFSDISGYGQADGTLDGVQVYPDCAIWFSLYQEDDDGDGMVYWEEVMTYGSNPVNVNDAAGDWDSDGMPNGWEDSHGLNPKSNDAASDLDGDSATNYWEYTLRTRGKSPDNPLDTYGFHLAICLQWDADSTYINSFVAGMRSVSTLLFEGTDGFFLIDSIEIWDNSQNYLESNIVVKPGLDSITPQLRCDGNKVEIGPVTIGDDSHRYFNYVYLPERYTNTVPVVDTVNDPDDPDYYRMVTHELCHLIFGVYDEYMDSDYLPIADPNTWMHSIMGCSMSPYNYQELSTHMTYEYPDPGTRTDTLQDAMYDASCWETLFTYWNYYSTALFGANGDDPGGLIWSLFVNSDDNRPSGVLIDLDASDGADTSYYLSYQTDTFSGQYPVGNSMTAVQHNT